jgi:DNA-binding SARP family transcriptional activator
VSVRIRLIGPLTVESDGREISGPALGGQRERRLLAILALARGEVVPKDVLAERLWDDPPRNPAAAIDTAVSLLRRALGAAAPALETARPGYRIRCASDLAELEALAAAHRWDEAVAGADGELLATEAGSDWVEARRREFARRRVEILVAAAEAAAAQGDDPVALDRFAAALAQDALREDAYRGQMGCLARLGRPAEALRAYERCRRVLREELGADPSAQTVALYEQILIGRPPQVGRPVRGAPAPVPLLGRQTELGRLTAPHDGCAVRVVLGEPGVGKSRLLDEALERLRRLDGRGGPGEGSAGEVRLTKCFRLMSPVPYAVLTDLVPELADEHEERRPGRRAEAQVARLAAAWGEMLAERPSIVVIDDLQWADEPSLAVLGLVLRRRPAGVLVLAAAREAELDPDGAARHLLDLAGGLGLVDTVTLEALSPDDFARGGYAFEDWKRTGGHPLLFTEWLRGGGDDDLASLIMARAASTGTEATELLRAAAVLDRAAPLADLAALAALSPAAARAAADRLSRQALVVESGGLWRVRHDVIAELVQADLAPAARVRWHARALTELQQADADPAELAHHALLAEEWPACLDASLEAGDRAFAAFANREAVGHYGRARGLLASYGPGGLDGDEVARRAVLGEARALIVLARTDEARRLVAALPTTTGRAHVERLLVEADCGWAAWKPSRAVAPAEEALRLAVELGDEALEGRVHAFIANPYGSLGELDRATVHVDAALAIADRRGEPPPAIVLYRMGLIQHQRGQEADALATLERCRQFALDQHDERALVFERVVRSWALGALGRYGEALAALDDIGAIGRGEEAVVRGRVPNTRASMLFDLGLFGEALDADEESLEITRGEGGAGVAEPQIQTLLNLATDHLQLGDPARAAAYMADAEAFFPDAEYARFRYLNRYHWVRGLLQLEAGDVDAALGEAAEVGAMAERHGAPKYAVRADLLRGLGLSRRQAERDAALASLRAAAHRAEGHGFAALAEQAHRAAAGLVSGGQHRRRAAEWRARIVGSVSGPLRERLR